MNFLLKKCLHVYSKLNLDQSIHIFYSIYCYFFLPNRKEKCFVFVFCFLFCICHVILFTGSYVSLHGCRHEHVYPWMNLKHLFFYYESIIDTLCINVFCSVRLCCTNFCLIGWTSVLCVCASACACMCTCQVNFMCRIKLLIYLLFMWIHICMKVCLHMYTCLFSAHHYQYISILVCIFITIPVCGYQYILSYLFFYNLL